jgi:alkyl hydroperoxide reductase subunit F
MQRYLQRVTQPIEIIASLDDGAASGKLHELLRDVASLSPLITLQQRTDDAERKPSFTLNRTGANMSICFAGLPMGHEFSWLVLGLLQVGGHPPKVEPAIIEQIRGMQGEFCFETYLSLNCQDCPEVVQALNLMAVLNPHIGALKQIIIATGEGSKAALSAFDHLIRTPTRGAER